ncbi:MAG: Crp/Fnr family transcriptional regulator [Deltaproteobacteria bacterium]|nr:Crp/Fnr family transcriptional regulator [Deltaproteobacteria bacterium]MBW1961343.1 Crp/Fnr family transcriptional regulator [Deltaproteobacteria bacterium]MBW2151798.1 Crp/Fnr family transcriptional regulator [Deltaproteobacteria bacterium]
MDPKEPIGSIPLFRELPDRQRRALASLVVDKPYKRGETVFSEGDEGSGFYVIISGRVKIFKFSPDGKEQILHIFGPGDPIGEAAMFAGKPFPANAAALEESRLFFFSRIEFMRLIKQDPTLAMNMLAVLSQRLQRFAALIEDLSLKEVPGRLAAYLLYLSAQRPAKETLQFDISMKQLSSLLGTIPETLSRIVTRMNKAGLIRSEGFRRIRIMDPASLKELASGKRRLD